MEKEFGLFKKCEDSKQREYASNMVLCLSRLLRQIYKLEEQVKMKKTNQTFDNVLYSQQVFPTLQNLILNNTIDETNIIIGLLYADRVTNKGDFFITKANAYNIVMIGIVLSVKMFNDYVDISSALLINMQYNRKEYRELEREYLKIIDYDLFIDEVQYKDYQQNLEQFLKRNHKASAETKKTNSKNTPKKSPKKPSLYDIYIFL
ncbi:hypothetical protein pb186bvf_004286 [Paramecium bursaria]